MTRFAGVLYSLRLPLCALFLVGAALFAPHAYVTRVDNDLEAWFAPDDPLYVDYERFRREFGGTQPLIIAFVVEANSRDPHLFTAERLAFLHDITEDIERIPSVARVQSLSTATVLASSDDGETLRLEPLLDLHCRSMDETRHLAQQDLLVRDQLVAADGSVAALIITFDEEQLNLARQQTLDRIYGNVQERLPAGLAVHYNGSIEIDETYNRVTVENQRKFIPPILLFTVIAVFLLFRSAARACVVLLSIAVSVAWTLGLYALMGFGFNILTAMLTPLIVVLAISDDVHVIQHYDHERRHAGAEEAFKRTVAYLTIPLLAASATTALGLLSLATSEIVAIRHFGIGAAVGIMVDFLSSLVLVPTLLTYVPQAAQPLSASRRDLPGRAAAFAIRQPRRVLVLTAAVGILAVVGISRLRVDTNHIGFFARTHPLSESAAVIDRSLAGVYSFHVLLEGPVDSLQSPDALLRLDRLAEQIAQLPEVRKVTSAAEYVKRAHRALSGGDGGAGALPRDSAMVAQEFFLIGMTSEGRRELAGVISSDFSTAQIVARMPSMSSGRVYNMIQEANALAGAAFEGTPIKATATGSGRLFSALDHYVVNSQITGFGTAFVTILCAMFLVFRSYQYGLLALVPNILPVIGVLGLMGWIGISINIATVMVASVALGVVDDDTVHFLHRVRDELFGGATVEQAALRAATIEGRAALTTAIVNSCGFAVLLLSEYKPSAWFGGLLAATLALAFVTEIFVLPAVLVTARRMLRAT